MVYLDEETHTYYNTENNEINYTSVTSLVNSYKEEFDKMYHASRVAKRENREVQDVLNEWQEKNRVANEYGTNLHKILENYLLTDKNQFYVPKNEYEEKVITEFENLELIKNEVKPEALLHLDFDHYHGIAGTADIIEKSGKESFNVWDFKTNKKFRYESPFNKWLHYPIDFLMECEYNIYCLQMSIYAYLFELQTARKANRLGALYWEKNQQQFSFIPMIYMKDTVKNLIEHFKIKHLKK